MPTDTWLDEEDREEGSGFLYCEVCDRLTMHTADHHDYS